MAFEDWEWRAMFNLVAQMNSTDSENEQLCRLGILRGIRQLVPYDAGSFFLADEARPENPLADPIAIGAPEGSMASYENYYYQFDYCRQFYPIQRSVVFTDRDFRESPTTGSNDAWGKFDFWVGSSLDCYIASDGVLMGCIALARKRGEEPFGEHDLEIFNTLMLHLENQMRARLGRDAEGAQERCRCLWPHDPREEHPFPRGARAHECRDRLGAPDIGVHREEASVEHSAQDRLQEPRGAPPAHLQPRLAMSAGWTDVPGCSGGVDRE